MQWSYGNDIVNANRLIFETGNKSYLNQYASFQSRWTPENTGTSMPRAGGQVGYAYSTRIIEDGSFLRLKTVQLGYTLPESLIEEYEDKELPVLPGYTEFVYLDQIQRERPRSINRLFGAYARL